MWRRTGIIAAMLIAIPATVQAQTTPANPVRAQLLDALRPVIARDIGQPVRFVVRDMRTYSGWAFVTVSPRTPGGAKIDFGKTQYAEQQREGMLDGDSIYALLRQERGRGGW